MATAEEKCDKPPFPTLRWVEPHRYRLIDDPRRGGEVRWFLFQMLFILGLAGLATGILFVVSWLFGKTVDDYRITFRIAMAVMLGFVLFSWFLSRTGGFNTWVTVSEKGVDTRCEVGPGRSPPIVHAWPWEEVVVCRLTKVLHDKDEFRVLELHLKSGKKKSIAIRDSISLVALENAIKAAGVDMRH